MNDPKIDAALWAEWPPSFVGPDAPEKLRAMMDVINSPEYGELFAQAVNEEVETGKELSYVAVYLAAKQRIDTKRGVTT